MSNTQLPAKIQRRLRTRAKISGSKTRPRLNVYISNTNIRAQLIDDASGSTLGSVTTVKAKASGSMTDKATWVGQQIAAVAKKQKISSVVFDRGSKIYHGRLHALAEAARAKGLEF